MCENNLSKMGHVLMGPNYKQHDVSTHVAIINNIRKVSDRVTC